MQHHLCIFCIYILLTDCVFLRVHITIHMGDISIRFWGWKAKRRNFPPQRHQSHQVSLNPKGKKEAGRTMANNSGHASDTRGDDLTWKCRAFNFAHTALQTWKCFSPFMSWEGPSCAQEWETDLAKAVKDPVKFSPRCPASPQDRKIKKEKKEIGLPGIKACGKVTQ